MENVLREDLPVGVYRTNDNVKNLKIRVRLRKISNVCFTDKDPLVFGSSNELELVDMIKSPSATEEHTFMWQEKVSKSEHYDRSDVEQSSLRFCLYSYTDADVISSKWTKPITLPNCNMSHLEQRLSKGRFKTDLGFSTLETWQKPLHEGFKRIVKEKVGQNQNALPFGQSMVIMAALFFDDNSPSEEIELCFLQVDSHGTLTVIPDFNLGKPFLFINSRSETYEYELQNVSNVMSESSLRQEKKLIEKIALYRRKSKDCLGLEYNKVQPDTIKFDINIEIVSAQDFNEKDLFVHYLIHLPKNLNTENVLEGVTSTSHCKQKNNASVAYYGHLFTLDIWSKLPDLLSETQSIKIVFEVTSVDSWGNFRNEGYGYGDIMLMPGMDEFSVQTWKVEPTTLKSKLQNFFIGGTPTLNDLSYIVDANETPCSQLSKYGVETISSGKVTFKSSVVKESSSLSS